MAGRVPVSRGGALSGVVGGSGATRDKHAAYAQRAIAEASAATNIAKEQRDEPKR
jgi:hypothetical protein